ncbi:hypothetical protein PoB_001929300 [Plakobranchus ocellatus]|uniref:Uncharacterized protein n=1 Tax=Plakobranchus ocellatus TaxID=259542 RepID=A0AAV3ZDX5_9GAST|nr:hypothetical protein PoB_001929300 [Plakobranchus ocellatus]
MTRKTDDRQREMEYFSPWRTGPRSQPPRPQYNTTRFGGDGVDPSDLSQPRGITRAKIRGNNSVTSSDPQAILSQAFSGVLHSLLFIMSLGWVEIGFYCL